MLVYYQDCLQGGSGPGQRENMQFNRLWLQNYSATRSTYVDSTRFLLPPDLTVVPKALLLRPLSSIFSAAP